jgi:hypothetical protein
MPERSVDPVPVVVSVICRPDSKVAQSLRRWHALISISMVEAIGCEFIATQAEKLKVIMTRNNEHKDLQPIQQY